MSMQFEVEGGRARESLTRSSGRRSSMSRKSDLAAKSWMNADPGVQDAASLQEAAAMGVIKCTTRFATCMCVVIATVKVGLYFLTKAAVVRTSALDSLGDFVANCMTLYTGYRMNNVDKKKYPVGQAKFQSIGCLVFSTFMFSLMFGNALGNVEDLVESPDDIGFASISRFFYQAGDDLGGDFKKFKDEGGLVYKDGFEWTGGDEIDNPLKTFFAKNGDEGEKEMAEEMEDKATHKEIVELAAEYENDADKKSELIKQNGFLACCATYKLCLWLYCILYAIPKSDSNVLRALATDKRNDFIGTYTVIFVTTLAYIFEDQLPVAEDKVDPLVSLLLSFFIMYSWSDLMIEHMVTLSQETASPEFKEEVVQAIQTSIQDSPCVVSQEEDIKVYMSSEKHTIEAMLSVKDAETPFKEVAKTTQMIKGALTGKGEVERVIVCAQTLASMPERY